MDADPWKYYSAMNISEYQLFEMRGFSDARYRRQVKERVEVHPTEQNWADYRAAKEAHDFLLTSPYFIDGGMDESSQVEEPRPYIEYIYAETEAQWLKRCRALMKEDQ